MPRRGRKRRTAAALLAVLLLVLLGLWSQRKPIARTFVDRQLRARGVPARYVISDLGLGRARMTGVVIGDAAAPDLTAEEVVVRVGYRLGWPTLHGVTARGVRLRGRLVDNALSLGSLDRLMPAGGGGGAPFSLPDLDIDLANTTMRLETPFGVAMLAVSGRGNLADGFVGQLGASAPRLAGSGCVAEAPSALLSVRTAGRRPRLAGPLQAGRMICAGVTATQPRADIVTTLAETLSPETAELHLAGAGLSRGTIHAGPWRGQIDYDGRDARDRHGAIRFAADRAVVPQGTARTASLDGRYRIGGEVALGTSRARPVRIEGAVSLAGLAVAPGRRGFAPDLARQSGAMPVAPLAAALADAVVRAARDVGGTAQVGFDGDIVTRPAGTTFSGELLLSALEADSRSGARLRLGQGSGLRLRLPSRLIDGDGRLTLAGGGFPETSVTFRQSDGALTGQAIIAPLASGGARLGLTPVRFEQDRAGGLRIATTATLDGPLGDGRVTGLSLPIAVRVADAITVNPACAPLAFTSLTIAGTVIGPSRLPLCPIGGAMLRVAGGVAGGGVRVGGLRLIGRVGSQPLSIAAHDTRVTIGSPGFTADAVAVRLGGENATQLDIARLDGKVDRGGIGGRFGDTSGRIANVPLLLSRGEGTWRLAGGRLGLSGALQVADAQVAAPRFLPLASREVTLDLVGGVIRGNGILREPKSGLAVTEVTLTHDLAKGRGGATLNVPGITFGPAFQPEALTPLTLGIVANVIGTVNGRGTIGWTPEGVTSSGDFATDGVDLAAAFGQVTGIRTKIHFSDLLALETPPGQLATIAELNPGIAVLGGEIGYQLLTGQKVAVGGGKWPFSGGALILEPTVLDFGQPVERRMTFRVEGMEAAQFIAQFDFKNIAASGTFDGTLPMIFDAKGGRIEGGRLVVRRGGGTLAYVGELSNEDLGMFGKMAFDALKAIKYDNLAIELDGALDGEIVSRIVFTGVNQNPAAGAKTGGWLGNLAGLPFKFNILVHAPFRGLTNSATAFVNPGALLGGAAASTPAAKPVQPPLSGTMR